MSIKDEMAKQCQANRKAGVSPCGGQVKITKKHLDAAIGSSPEDKREDIKADAASGCMDGCVCQKLKPEIIVKLVNGKRVEYVRSTCLPTHKEGSVTDHGPPPRRDVII
jgi:hypothetical protein